MKERLGTLRIAMIFAGSYLGAGYVSGQELWQFFGCYGSARAWLGLGLTLLLLLLLGAAVMMTAKRLDTAEMDKVIIPREIPWLRAASAALELVMLFSFASIMFAGGGAMLHQVFGCPAWIGNVALCVCAVCAAASGLRGISRVYSVTVPLIVLSTAVLGVLAALRYGLPAEVGAAEKLNPMTPTWAAGSLTFTAYNAFSAVATEAPAGQAARRQKTTVFGALLGCVLLAGIAASVLLALFIRPDAAAEEVPMLAVAYALGRPVGIGYGLLLLLAIFGTAVSMLAAVQIYAEERFPVLKKRHIAVLTTLAAAALAASFFGFGELIGALYPLFGYAGGAFMIFMLVCFVRDRFKKRQ